MKNIAVILFVLVNLSVFGQEKHIQIRFCDEILKGRMNPFVSLSIIIENDTFKFIQHDSITFSNIIYESGLITDSLRKKVKIIYENKKYIYEFDGTLGLFSANSISICLKKVKRNIRQMLNGIHITQLQISYGSRHGICFSNKRKKSR